MSEFSDFEDEEGVEEPYLNENEDEQPEEEEVKENPLTQEVVAESLSLLCKTGNGLAHAYVRLDIHQREITDVSILKHFIHLRYVDITENKIRDITPLNFLTHLLSIKAEKNLLKSAKLNKMPYLQQAIFSDNKISEIDEIQHPLLEVLNLNGNDITEVQAFHFKALTRLTMLELKANKLTTTEGLVVPSVKKLYLGENKIKTLVDLSYLENLTVLHLRQNHITTLDGFSESLKNLQYLNLRKNDISAFSEVEKLSCLPRLRALILRQNPLSLEETYRIEVLVLLRRLERLDQDVYAEDERQEAEEIYNQRQEAENQHDNSANIEVINSEEED